MSLNKLASWIFPEGVLLAAAVVVTNLDALQGSVARLTPSYAAAVLGAGAAVGLRFSRSRLVFALLLFTLADRLLPHLPFATNPVERAAFQAIAILLPLNLVAFSLLPERGLLTTSGIARLGAILGQAIVAAAFVTGAPAQTARALGRALIPAALTKWTPLGDIALAAFVLATALLVVSFFFEFGSGGRPALWALAAAFLALNSDLAGPRPTFFLATAGLLLVVGMVEASFSLAYRDGLTGLPSRRAFNEALERRDGPGAIAMVDVDHFKRVNDTHGHDVGDQVLKMVASHLAGVREGGKAFRYGGEEFAILFPGKTPSEVLEELERLRAGIADAGFAVRGRMRRRRKPRPSRITPGGKRPVLEVTVSIGVAKEVAAADRALYAAKEGGRNRVES